MRLILLVSGIVLTAVSLIVGVSTLNQVNREEVELSSRLESRTLVLAESFSDAITPAYRTYATSSVEDFIDKMVSDQRIAGVGVFDNTGIPMATSDGLPDTSLLLPLLTQAMDSNESVGIFESAADMDVFMFATPLHGSNENSVIGALVIVQNSAYIGEAISTIWRENLSRLVLQAFVFLGGVLVLVRWALLKPLLQLTESVKAVRRGDAASDELLDAQSFFNPLTSEISKITHSLKRARLVASEEARLRLEKLDSPWTAERLKEFFKAHLKGRRIFVVSNREPYIHTKEKNKVTWKVPASGMVTALEPVMEACGGLWLAHGSGNADREVVDEHDKIQVPPDEPRYVLKRVWLTDEEMERYYNGFSNEAMYPLCLLAHTRPLFRVPDWQMYRKVNGKFAQSLLAEIKNIERPMVMVQDYHFALLPKMIKDSRPDAEIGIFWHIPWPSAETFSICPWRKEVLEGMLGADLIGFHTQQHCNNFLETVSKEVESIVNFEEFSITRGNHTTHVKPFPISVAFPDSGNTNMSPASDFRETYKINSQYLGIGVDRLDYTKGFMEKLKGLEFFFGLHPDFIEKFTFLQIAPFSREGVQKYREFNEVVTAEVDRINKKFERNNWKPIVMLKKHFSHKDIYPLYRSADLCLITSLSDGMNLVAKEYVAARNDEAGVLIVSQFAGAARDSKSGALILNPYSAEETAETIYQALTMPASEQRRRMKKMRDAVRDYNVYRWAAEFLKALSNTS